MKPDISLVLKSGHFHLLPTLPSRPQFAPKSVSIRDRAELVIQDSSQLKGRGNVMFIFVRHALVFCTVALLLALCADVLLLGKIQRLSKRISDSGH